MSSGDGHPADCTCCCPCPEWPELWWRRWDGVWINVKPVDNTADPVTDSTAYYRSGCTEWKIVCPSCGMGYGSGR